MINDQQLESLLAGDDLANHLKFSPDEGRIWFADNPVVLIRPATLALLHWELNKKLGHQEAGAILARLGYESGVREANLARRLFPQASLEQAFLIGAKLRALRGLISIKILHQELDTDSGLFSSEAVFSGDFEVDTRTVEGGMPNSPVCWNEVSYASGFASTLLGRPIIYKEVQCSATGAHQCRMVGKSLEMWYDDEIQDELAHLPPKLFAGHTAAQRIHQPQPKYCTLPERSSPPELLGGLIGTSPGIQNVCHMLQKVARTSAPVLLLGETGVGKERVAKTLHQISARADEPFVAINCAAIPDELIEAELFGVAKGAFTGATQSRPGRFERAHRGTLFLDEVGCLTKAAQTKLLRVVQEQEIERLGDTFMRSVDVRIVAATNEDLQTAVKAGNFREDLLFRLNVFPIEIPPLRNRREDIPLLMAHFLARYNRRHQKEIPGFTHFATEALYRYDYPGNIRELENLVERTVILAEQRQPIDLSHLFGTENLISAGLTSDHDHHHLPQNETQALCANILDIMLTKKASIHEVEHRLLKNALAKAGNNMSKAAKMMGLSRPKMAYRLQKHEDDAEE